MKCLYCNGQGCHACSYTGCQRSGYYEDAEKAQQFALWSNKQYPLNPVAVFASLDNLTWAVLPTGKHDQAPKHGIKL